MKTALALLLTLATSAAGSPDSAEVKSASDSAATLYEPSIAVAIDTLTITDGSLYDTLDITVTADNCGLSGGSLKIATTSPYIDIVDILPGAFIDSCRWAMFDSRENKPTIPDILEQWKITTLFQIVPDTLNPPCPLRGGPVQFARVVVSNLHVADQPDTAAQLFFLHESCTDNTFSDTTGQTSFVSHNVHAWTELPILRADSLGFPSTAMPESCIDQRAAHPLERAIDFYCGGVRFRYEWESPPPDSLQDTTGR